VSLSLVVDPAFGFASLDARLASLGFRRDASVRPVTPDILPGEPELAAWTRGDGERLTYTFNPVVSLRAIATRGLTAETANLLAAQLPLLDTGAIAGLLADPEPRRVLLGLFAARALAARELALAVAPLQFHADETIRRAAAGTLEALAFGGEATARQKALAVLQVLCEQAIPALAALVGPEGPAVLEAMRPRAEDYARVFHREIVDAARAAYEVLWRTPPQLDQLVSGELTLRVDAAPAGMLSEENELSNRFPGGYRALAPYLQPDRIWFVWRYLHPGETAGMRYDGVVRLDDRWVWFPKPYRVVGEILRSNSS
jgi:hypothetical protein